VTESLLPWASQVMLNHANSRHYADVQEAIKETQDAQNSSTPPVDQ
jgi:hypothetical protein